MGNYHRIVLALLVSWSAEVSAAPLCDRAVSTSMKNPPIERRVKFSTVPLADTNLFISVAVDPAKPVSIVAAQLNKTELTSVVTKDRAKANGIRVFTVPDDGAGLVDVVITYSEAPQADAITVVACSGMNVLSPINAVDHTPTAQTQEMITITGNDATTSVLELVSDDAANMMRVVTPGVRSTTKRAW